MAEEATSPVQSSPKCAACSKSAPSQACGGCKNAPSHKTYYCDANCQTADWVVHKKICKGLQLRLPLYRAGSILQDVFYAYREKFFDRQIAKIELRDGKIFLHDGEYGPTCSEYHAIRPFPSHLLPDPKYKKAILVHLCCGDSAAWMHGLIKTLVSDLADDVSEIAFKLKNPKIHLVSVDINGGEEYFDYEHHIIRVTLKHGSGIFALDLTGAQYGYDDPVIPWSEYCQSRVQTIDCSFPQYFGASRVAMKTQEKMPSWEGAITRLNMMGAEWTEGQVGVLISQKHPIPAFLKYQKSEFDVIGKILVQELSQVYDKMVQYLKDKTLAAMKAGKGKKVNVNEQYAKLGIDVDNKESFMFGERRG